MIYEIIKPYILTFIPIFVAVNILGTIPIFVSLTGGYSRKRQHQAIASSLMTASVIALIFMLIGKLIFSIMGVTESDFKIAGGILLLILSVNLLLPGDSRRTYSAEVGVFPMGTPLITGPAVLATVLASMDAHGIVPTLISFGLNMAVAWVVLVNSHLVIRFMGVGGAKAFSKVADILLSAIAVMMIRSGILQIISNMGN